MSPLVSPTKLKELRMMRVAVAGVKVTEKVLLEELPSIWSAPPPVLALVAPAHAWNSQRFAELPAEADQVRPMPGVPGRESVPGLVSNEEFPGVVSAM